MKLKYSFIIIQLFVFCQLSAQTDTSAYQTQRAKVNRLLAERSSRFGQYDTSLGKRSGIFGMKTKRDMQASNNILRQIVLTDNDIFSELKILLDYKDFEKKQVQEKAETIESRIDRYQTTITRLQQNNENLKIEAEKNLHKADKLFNYLLIILITLIIAIWYIVILKKLPKTDKSGLKNA